MRAIWLLALVLTAATVGPVAAQDTAPDPVRAERLRRMIEERFGERLREELALSDEQAARVRSALAGIAAKRRGLEQNERRLRQALAGQLRPGVAANADSVAKLVDALTTGRVAYAETFREEMRELGAILNPVQRGQYFLMRDRLMQRVQEILEQRQAPPGAGGPRRMPPPALP
jgi:hypothetical protein